MRTQAITAIGRVRTTESLYAFSRKLAGTATLDDVLWATAYQTALMLKVRVVLLLPEDGVVDREGGLSARGSARQGRSCRRELGLGATTARPAAARIRCRAPSACSCRCAPAAAPIGVIGIDNDKTGPLLTPDQRRLLDALIDQGALAIERVLLVEDMDRVKRTVEIGPPALGAVDLDLARSQDAAGLGARRRLHDARPCRRPDDTQKRDLLATVIDESERLNRFIANLLDMTKLESGAIVPNTARHDIGEIVGSALAARR